MSTPPVNILVADDHELLREGIKSRLEKHPGWKVCAEAADGREAVELALRLRPDVVVMDIGMKELNGLDAARQIHKAAPEMRVLILTMQESETMIGDALAAGVHGYILKTDAARLLPMAVEALLAQKTFFPSVVTDMLLTGFLNASVGAITDVNQQMAALTGYAREELIGSAFKNYFTDPQRAEEGIRQVLREGKVTNYELTALAKSGRMTIVSYNASTFRDADGKLQGVFAAARDITAQKELETQLRESQAYNRGLIEASVDGLVTVDPKGLVSDVNEQMSRMSGYSRQELIGTPFADYFADSDRATSGVKETDELVA